MLRKITYTTLIIFTVLLGFYGYLFWDNNRQTEQPTLSEIQYSLSASIDWLERNEEKILDENNSVLWWMIRQSSELTGNARLKAIFAKYESRYLTRRQGNLWLPLFVENVWLPVRYEDIAKLPDYNKHFIYAMNCDEELGNHPEIAAQNAEDFCDAHPLRPACATHQLMGIRIMQRRSCGDQDRIANTVKSLQERIERQLTWDPRVVDVYLQRVLLLTESGARDLVKPIWLRHVLDAQRDSGGWSGFEPLLPLPDGHSFGFSGHGFAFRKTQESFHPTAQGVFLMSLLSR